MRIRMLLACLLLVVAAGCGSDTAEPKTQDSPQDSAAPASGPSIEGTNYSYHAPEGWEIPSEKPPGFDPDSLVAETDPGDEGFARNINVVRAPTGDAISLDAVEKESLGILRSTVGDGIETCPRRRVETVDAACFTGPAKFGSTRYYIVQLAAPRDEALYTVTFSFSPKDSRAEREEIVSSVLSSWEWS